jgi:hypothetical protein
VDRIKQTRARKMRRGKETLFPEDHMPKSPKKHPQEKDFLKRRSLQDGLKLADAAHVATWRLYCETLHLWRACKGCECRRHRRCLGQPASCLMRSLSGVSQAQRLAAATDVIAGGPRRAGDASGMAGTPRTATGAHLVAGVGEARMSNSVIRVISRKCLALTARGGMEQRPRNNASWRQPRFSAMIWPMSLCR